MNAAELAETISGTDFSGCAATVVGFGNMGRQYVKALRALGVEHVRVCSRSAGPLQELHEADGVETVSGGFEGLNARPGADELGIVATPVSLLVPASERLADLGFRRLLIEKPVSLWSQEIEQLAERFGARGVTAACAYNRVAYPGVCEALARARQEGGITSCTYTFTELMSPDWPERFPPQELARWGIANSLHVMSMAHRLIGLPARWSAFQAGAGRWPWHPSGAVFTGGACLCSIFPFRTMRIGARPGAGRLKFIRRKRLIVFVPWKR